LTTGVRFWRAEAYYSENVKTAKPLRALAPGAAWNEALRRSLAICIAGFFLPNLLAEFGAIPQLDQSFHFLPGVCGTAGAFLASLALFMGYYHRKLIQSAAFAVCAAILPYLATWFWFRLAHPSDSAGMLQLCGPTAIAAIVGYGFLIWWHAGQSRLTIESLSTQLNDDDYGMPASRWQQLIVRASTAIGFILVLLALLSALHTRN
jgi:hypothetical protein